MFCGQCGTKLDDNARFCYKCGTPTGEGEPLKAPEQQIQPAENIAPQPQTAAKPALPKSYRAVNVMEYGDYDWPYVYPGIDETGRIIEEKTDHGLGIPIIAKTIEMSQNVSGGKGYKTVLRASDIKLEFYITDCRVVFLCDQYDKGGTWTGGLTALALTAIERGVAKARTKGKTLAGHIRYEWMKHIMYIRKSGFLSNEAIRLVYTDRSDTYWQIELDFDKNTDSSAIANDILHRAAHLRASLNCEGLIPESSMQFYREQAQPQARIQHNDAKNTYSYVTFPDSFKAPGAEGRNPEWSI